ncbi:hypothetical protein WMY93_012670 [Mugilogobius chulae]|uniref:Uncharacterized protein n=1 Tax=Mugilogobius chulae TaxID=88201 RepID=A0AAW0P9A1_9GOBI
MKHKFSSRRDGAQVQEQERWSTSSAGEMEHKFSSRRDGAQVQERWSTSSAGEMEHKFSSRRDGAQVQERWSTSSAGEMEHKFSRRRDGAQVQEQERWSTSSTGEMEHKFSSRRDGAQVQQQERWSTSSGEMEHKFRRDEAQVVESTGPRGEAVDWYQQHIPGQPVFLHTSSPRAHRSQGQVDESFWELGLRVSLQTGFTLHNIIMTSSVSRSDPLNIIRQKRTETDVKGRTMLKEDRDRRLKRTETDAKEDRDRRLKRTETDA